jgi:hypothetical protein
MSELWKVSHKVNSSNHRRRMNQLRAKWEIQIERDIAGWMDKRKIGCVEQRCRSLEGVEHAAQKTSALAIRKRRVKE